VSWTFSEHQILLAYGGTYAVRQPPATPSFRRRFVIFPNPGGSEAMQQDRKVQLHPIALVEEIMPVILPQLPRHVSQVLTGKICS
jgi:hypothetical protein